MEEVNKRADNPRAPSEALNAAVSVAKLRRWVGIIKLEPAANVEHTVALELHFNDRVPLFGQELIETSMVWAPGALKDMPMREQLGSTLAPAHAWMVDATLVPGPKRLWIWHYFAECVT